MACRRRVAQQLLSHARHACLLPFPLLPCAPLPLLAQALLMQAALQERGAAEEQYRAQLAGLAGELEQTRQGGALLGAAAAPAQLIHPRPDLACGCLLGHC